MRFYTYGSETAPVIVMLTGSFCPASSLEYLYSELSESYYIIVPEYNGHQADTVFTTRRNEAEEIAEYISGRGMADIKLLYGQSMGAEVGIELMKRLSDRKVKVDKSFFDGAPCIRLSNAYRAFMYFKFKTLIKMMRSRQTDEILNWGFLKQFTNGDNESLRPMIEAVKSAAPYLTDESIKNETECCYTFDFPSFDDDVQENMHFFYAEDEKAYKTCFKYVQKAYPLAKYKIVRGYGHITYSVRNRADYIAMLRRICE